MASQVKRFGEHSQRWQKEARRQGMTAAKWNKWRRLSPTARKETNPRDYAKGKTVAEFRLDKLNQAVFATIDAIHRTNPKYRPRTVRARIFGGFHKDGTPIETMTLAEKRKVLSFKSLVTLKNWITEQIRKATRGADSPWFYQ